MQETYIIDISIVLIYLLICLFLGFNKFKSIKTIRHYTLGFYPVNTTILVTAIFATFYGAGSTISAVGIYSLGLVYSIPMIFEIFSWFITARIFGRNIDKFRGYLTLSEIMSSLYGSHAGWITSIVSLIQAIGVVTIQVTATGYIFYYFFNIPHTIGILLGFGILILYSTFGGIRSITLTDIFQFAILYIAIPTACAFVYQDHPESINIANKVPSISLTEINCLLFFTMIFDAMIPHAEPTFIQRYLMSANKVSLEKSLYITALISIPFIAILSFIGFLVSVKVPTDIPYDSAFLYLILHYVPIGIKGFIVAGLLAVVMSSADSWLNNSAVICAHDISKNLFTKLSNRQELLIARIATFTIALIAVFLSLKGQNLLKMVWLIDNLWQPLILIPISSGFLGFYTDKKSFHVSLVVAIICTLTGAYIAGEFSTLSLTCGVIGSAIGLFGTHLYLIRYHELVSNFKNKRRPLSLRISMLVTQIFNGLAKFTHKQVKKQEPLYYIFSVILTLSYLIPLIITLLLTQYVGGIEALSLYLAAAAVCMILFFHDHWPEQWRKKFLFFYWCFAVLFCLPYISSYFLFVNNMQGFYVVSFILSVFLLYLFTDWYTFLIISAIGIMLGYISFSLVDSMYKNLFYISDTYYIIKCLYDFTAIVLLILWNYNERAHNEKIEPVRLLGATIAHELRTPLSIINIQANNLAMNNTNLNNATEVKDIILKSVKRGQYFIDNILMNLRELPSEQDMENIEISSCVSESINSFPFVDGQEKIISINLKSDFTFKGNKLFVIHVISNLLNNSIYYTKQAENPMIKITADVLGSQKIVTIYDNGIGMDRKTLDNIFRPFYTKRKAGGVGIGLAFCKMVMEGLGGSIDCQSEAGKFTEFKLIFP